MLFKRRSWPSSRGDQHQLFRDLWEYVTWIYCVLATAIQVQQSLEDGRDHSQRWSSSQSTQDSPRGWSHPLGDFHFAGQLLRCCWHGTRLCLQLMVTQTQPLPPFTLPLSAVNQLTSLQLTAACTLSSKSILTDSYRCRHLSFWGCYSFGCIWWSYSEL